EHALLAFEILTWGLRIQPAATRRALERTLAEGQPLASAAPDRWSPARVQRWNRAGRLTPFDKAELDESSWRLTVRPLLRELLSGPVLDGGQSTSAWSSASATPQVEPKNHGASVRREA